MCRSLSMGITGYLQRVGILPIYSLPSQKKKESKTQKNHPTYITPPLLHRHTNRFPIIRLFLRMLLKGFLGGLALHPLQPITSTVLRITFTETGSHLFVCEARKSMSPSNISVLLAYGLAGMEEGAKGVEG